jgi:predicted Zn-dependent protease
MKRIFAIISVALACTGCASGGMPLGSIGSISGFGAGGAGGVDVGKAIQTAQKVQDATKEYTEAEEIVLGREVASNLLGAHNTGLYHDRNMQRYVNRVGRWLAAQTERPDLPWHFVVLNNNGINAFAAPGGYIFITSGLMGRMRSEAELAGVLGHEIAHVLKKHHLKSIQKGKWAEIGADVGSQVLASKGGVNPVLANLAANLVKNLYVSGLSKEEEYEADRMGVVIAARGGYDPYGLPAVLQMMQVFSPDDPAYSLTFATHPPIPHRLATLDRLMSPALDRFEKQPALDKRFIGHLPRK